MVVTIDTVTLRSPETSEVEVWDAHVSIHHGRKPLPFVVSDWTATYSKKWSFKYVTRSVMDTFRTWLGGNIGREVLITDAFGDSFMGIIVSDKIEFVEVSVGETSACDRYDFNITLIYDPTLIDLVLLEDGSTYIITESSDYLLQE